MRWLRILWYRIRWGKSLFDQPDLSLNVTIYNIGNDYERDKQCLFTAIEDLMKHSEEMIDGRYGR